MLKDPSLEQCAAVAGMRSNESFRLLPRDQWPCLYRKFGAREGGEGFRACTFQGAKRAVAALGAFRRTAIGQQHLVPVEYQMVIIYGGSGHIDADSGQSDEADSGHKDFGLTEKPPRDPRGNEDAGLARDAQVTVWQPLAKGARLDQHRAETGLAQERKRRQVP